jgi:hypothetical protein
MGVGERPVERGVWQPAGSRVRALVARYAFG